MSDKLQRCPHCEAVIGAEEMTCPSCKAVLVETAPAFGSTARSTVLPQTKPKKKKGTTKRRREPWGVADWFGWGVVAALVGAVVGAVFNALSSDGSGYGWAVIGASIGGVFWTIGIIGKGVEVGVRAANRRP